MGLQAEAGEQVRGGRNVFGVEQGSELRFRRVGDFAFDRIDEEGGKRRGRDSDGPPVAGIANR